MKLKRVGHADHISVAVLKRSNDIADTEKWPDNAIVG